MTYEKDIRELVRTLTGMPANSVRPANQNAKTGPKDEQFATVYITSRESRGWDTAEIADQPDPSTELTEYVVTFLQLEVSVQFFRAGANRLATLLASKLQSSPGLELLQKLKIGVEDIGRVADMTQVVDTFYEERARITLALNVIDVQSSSIKTFGTFPFTVTTPDNTTDFEVTEP